MKLKVEGLDKQVYECAPMSWDDVDRVESVLSEFLLNLQDNIAEAKTKTARLAIRKQLTKTKAEQRKLVEDMLRKYFGFSTPQLVELGFIGATVLFNRMYKANTELTPFLDKQSEQPSSSDSQRMIAPSSLSPS
jgi:hypothetical protein